MSSRDKRYIPLEKLQNLIWGLDDVTSEQSFELGEPLVVFWGFQQPKTGLDPCMIKYPNKKILWKRIPCLWLTGKKIWLFLFYLWVNKLIFMSKVIKIMNCFFILRTFLSLIWTNINKEGFSKDSDVERIVYNLINV